MREDINSKKVDELIDQCLFELSSLSPKTLKITNKLLKIAKDTNDDSLKSFAYYHQALYHYFKREISKYQPLVKKAVYYALRDDDQTSIARIYNFIAVDNHNNGALDIAYNYFMLAYNYANNMQNEGLMAIIESNLSRLYAELKEYKKSRKYIRSSIRRFDKDKSAVNYIQAAVTLKVNDGIISIMLDDIKTAEKALLSVNKLINKMDEESAKQLDLPRSLLATKLALKKDDKTIIRKELNNLLSLFKDDSLVQELIDDVSSLYHELISHNMKKEAKALIDITNDAFMSTDITYVISQFYQLKADYYERVKDDKKLFEILKEQNKLNTKLRNEQQAMYAHAVSLISLLDDIREEQTKVRNENEDLKHITEIDALTGIANRFKLNQLLNEIEFENKNLAIGILDIDYFKEYNDNYGHLEGDKCLISVAKELSRIASDYNLFCSRFGGDEFVVIYDNYQIKDLDEIVKNIQNRIKNLKIKHEYSHISKYLTVSQGVCYGEPENRAALWGFLSIADEALYAIKKSRENNDQHSSYQLIKYSSK